MTFDEWWKKNGIEMASYAEKSAARKGWKAGAAAEREAIVKKLLELGALEDGTYVEAIRARGEKGGA